MSRSRAATYDARTWGALGYLVVFGSVVAFTSYVWLLANAPISFVATYAYVNPVVAVFLGWLVLDEAVTPRCWSAAGSWWRRRTGDHRRAAAPGCGRRAAVDIDCGLDDERDVEPAVEPPPGSVASGAAELDCEGDPRLVSDSTTIAAPPEVVFAIVADPRQHARIDGSGSVRGLVTGPARLEQGRRRSGSR